MGISKCNTTERNGKTSIEVGGGLFMITEVHQERRFYRLSTGRVLTLKISSHTTYTRKIGIYLQTVKKGIT